MSPITVTIENIFKDHLTLIQVVLYAGVISILWFAEVFSSLNPWKDKLRHSGVNFLFIFTALPIQLSLTLIVIVISQWAFTNHWGILFLLPYSNSIWVKYVAGFFLLDFFEYVYHVTMHKVKSLWKFHLVHHTDTQLDVSTTVREHPGETFIRVCFLGLWVFLSGASIGLLVLRQTVQTFSNIIAHTHFRLPRKTDKILGLLLITPNLHQVHHHDKMPYTDCNYGDVLSIWDRLFGTYKEMEAADINFGLDVFDSKHASHFSYLLQSPFPKKNRPTG
eukprot:gene14694-17818_t